jgi:hypothetical protein
MNHPPKPRGFTGVYGVYTGAAGRNGGRGSSPIYSMPAASLSLRHSSVWHTVGSLSHNGRFVLGDTFGFRYTDSLHQYSHHAHRGAGRVKLDRSYGSFVGRASGGVCPRAAAGLSSKETNAAMRRMRFTSDLSFVDGEFIEVDQFVDAR